MNRSDAEKLVAVLHPAKDAVLRSLELAREALRDEELQAYTRAVGLVLGEFELELLGPLVYREYPDLRPPLPEDARTREAMEQIREKFRRQRGQ